MLRIAICDDDTRFTGRVDELLGKEASTEGMEIEVEVFFDGTTLENSVRQGNRYDLIYMDIEMEHKDGIEAARNIREMDGSVLLIYISGHEQYLKELFEVEPFRFLLKPLDLEKFGQYFRDACRRIAENNVYFQFKYNKEIRKVPLRDITYFESRNRMVHIHFATVEEEYFYGKLNDVEKELNKSKHRFLRIHQSYLVNYDFVRKMNFSNLGLDIGGGREISLQISEDRQKKVRMQLCQIAGRKAVVVDG